jgi:hypothetical protein
MIEKALLSLGNHISRDDDGSLLQEMKMYHPTRDDHWIKMRVHSETMIRLWRALAMDPKDVPRELARPREYKGPEHDVLKARLEGETMKFYMKDLERVKDALVVLGYPAEINRKGCLIFRWLMASHEYVEMSPLDKYLIDPLPAGRTRDFLEALDLLEEDLPAAALDPNRDAIAIEIVKARLGGKL